MAARCLRPGWLVECRPGAPLCPEVTARGPQLMEFHHGRAALGAALAGSAAITWPGTARAGTQSPESVWEVGAGSGLGGSPASKGSVPGAALRSPGCGR